MRHVSMLPPREEPYYRAYMKNRVVRWAEISSANFAAKLLEKRRDLLDAHPIVATWNRGQE